VKYSTPSVTKEHASSLEEGCKRVKKSLTQSIAKIDARVIAELLIQNPHQLVSNIIYGMLE